MRKQVFIYGSVFALLALVLNAVDYFHMVRVFPTELYIAIIALLFTGLGIWTGKKLTSPVSHSNQFTPNTKALDYLGISEREMEVLKLMAEGYSNRQIADRLFISINTVKTHVSSLLGKLDARRRTQAIKKARSLKLIS